MDAPDTALQGQNTTVAGRLYMAFELGEKSWKLSLGDDHRAPSRRTVAAGDTSAVLTAIANARARCHLGADTPVYSCYEAGRDGFWLHRWLAQQGIANLVVDSASIEVNRRSRRAKTDRLDSDKLLSMLMRYYAGEHRVWAVARIPTPEQEDDRRLHRELERLRQERTAHTNRIRSLLVLHNLRVRYVGGRIWTHTGGPGSASNCRPACAPRLSMNVSGSRLCANRSACSKHSRTSRCAAACTPVWRCWHSLRVSAQAARGP
jgi:transposase